MKKYFLIVFVSMSLLASAQPGKKPASTEKAPTQKEMEDMMKEAQKAMGEISAEDKKMMDSMGLKMPTFKDVPKVSDNDLATAWEDENRIVPKKDVARIAAIAPTPAGASMGAYLSSTHTKVLAVMKPAAKTLAEKIYAQLKASGKNAAEIGNVATGLWLAGRTELAIYIMGKTCMDDTNDPDNLNNYGAMLSMSGGQQLAIPILNNLNGKFRGNATVLNNLGQAWFGLGDIPKAEKYIDSTIRIYAMHSQANFTKCYIEESKGNTETAVQILKKSIKEAYSQEKEDKLRKMGKKLEGGDVRLPPLKGGDVLGLSDFQRPPVPKSVADCIALEPVWNNFYRQCTEKILAMERQIERLADVVKQAQEKRINENLAMIRTSQELGAPQGVITVAPMYIAQASLKLKEYTSESVPGGFYSQFVKITQSMVDFVIKTGVPLQIEYDKTIEQLSQEESDQTGEGMPNRDYCPRKRETADKFLSTYNGKLEPMMEDYLKMVRRQKNEMIDIMQYTLWPEQYEVAKLQMKIGWLHELQEPGGLKFKSITTYKCATKSDKGGGKLSEFDDVACKYHSTMKLGALTMQADCSRWTTTIDAPFVKLGLKQDMDKTNFGDQFMSGSAEFTASVGGKMSAGPVAVGGKVGGGVGVEIDRSGWKDVYLIGGASANAGVGPAKLSAGLEGRVSLVSGNSGVVGTGIFKGR